jgi:hypothetical protein
LTLLELMSLLAHSHLIILPLLLLFLAKTILQLVRLATFHCAARTERAEPRLLTQTKDIGLVLTDVETARVVPVLAGSLALDHDDSIFVLLLAETVQFLAPLAQVRLL